MFPNLSKLLLTGPPASKRPRDDASTPTTTEEVTVLAQIPFKIEGFAKYTLHWNDLVPEPMPCNLNWMEFFYLHKDTWGFRVTDDDSRVHAYERRDSTTAYSRSLKEIYYQATDEATTSLLRLGGSSNGYFTFDQLLQSWGDEFEQMRNGLSVPGGVKFGVRFSSKFVAQRPASTELWLTLWASSQRLYPNIYAATWNDGVAIYVVEQGPSLDLFLKQTQFIGNPIVDRVGGQLAALMSRCAESRLLMLDIKPGNLIALVRAVYAIDLDTEWTKVLPMTTSPACVLVCNATLLIRFIKCNSSRTEERKELSHAMIGPLVRILGFAVERIKNSPDAQLCNLLNNLMTPNESRDAPLQETYAVVASMILERARHYTHYDGDRPGDCNTGLDGMKFDNAKPIWPQLIAHAKNLP